MKRASPLAACGEAPARPQRLIALGRTYPCLILAVMTEESGRKIITLKSQGKEGEVEVEEVERSEGGQREREREK